MSSSPSLITMSSKTPWPPPPPPAAAADCCPGPLMATAPLAAAAAGLLLLVVASRGFIKCRTRCTAASRDSGAFISAYQQQQCSGYTDRRVNSSVMTCAGLGDCKNTGPSPAATSSIDGLAPLVAVGGWFGSQHMGPHSPSLVPVCIRCREQYAALPRCLRYERVEQMTVLSYHTPTHTSMHELVPGNSNT
jgi:hypothetical protein